MCGLRRVLLAAGPMLRALVLTPGQIRSVSLLSFNHEEQLPQPCSPQCLPGLLLLLASRENSWLADAASCSTYRIPPAMKDTAVKSLIRTVFAIESSREGELVGMS